MIAANPAQNIIHRDEMYCADYGMVWRSAQAVRYTGNANSALPEKTLENEMQTLCENDAVPSSSVPMG
jgi:hypothetical protein